MEKIFKYFTMMLTAVLMAFGLASCSESTEGEAPDTPGTPTGPTDGETVPASGGTITKGDFAITFPAGTFESDTKVTIEEVSGERCGVRVGECEASPFYRVSMPITTRKPTAIRIKSAVVDDDVQFIFHSKGYLRSSNRLVDANTILASTYSNGDYTVILPVFNNDDYDTYGEFIIGLAHIRNDAGEEGAGTREMAEMVEEGEVNGLKWKLYIDPEANDPGKNRDALQKEATMKMNDFIKETIQMITDMGYRIKDKNRVIPFYYFGGSDKWCCFKQDGWSDSFSCIGLSIEKMNNITKPDCDTLALKSDLLHETFHYFQADYDPRCAARKCGNLFDYGVDNENILYEMSAVWVEQFMRERRLNGQFLANDVFRQDGCLDIIGLGLDEQRWAQLGNNSYDAYTRQGYMMAPLLFYLCTEMDAYGIKNRSALDLHQLWSKKWVDRTYTSYHILDEWIGSYGSNFFTGSQIDDYYIKLWRGKMVEGVGLEEVTEGLPEYTNPIDSKSTTRSYTFEGNVYPFGCSIKRVVLSDFKDSVLTNKELVVKLTGEGVHTYLFIKTPDNNNYSFYQRDKVIYAIEQGDSIVLEGPYLERFKNSEGMLDTNYYLVTTNISNEMHSTKINPYSLSVQFRDMQKGQGNMRTDIQNLYVDFKVHTVGGSYASDHAETANLTFKGQDLKVMKTGTTLTITGKGEETNFYGKDNTTLSLTIDYSSPGSPAVTNLEVNSIGHRKYISEELNIEWSLQASYIPFESYHNYGGTKENHIWRAKEEDGAKITSYSNTTETIDGQGNKTTYNLLLNPNPENIVVVTIDYP